ncbi:hypothetical protein ACFQVC_32665 [Streptomyces monticola]|uniref:Uncharacterized protein n=1 Tax=Streptomyces monticola TaxID=2666263 RepID=A0ABW2JU65_9ACTN
MNPLKTAAIVTGAASASLILFSAAAFGVTPRPDGPLIGVDLSANASVGGSSASPTTPCTYQGYKAGYNLIALYGYTNEDLQQAIVANPKVPQDLSTAQMLQVLYRCTDTDGTIEAVEYCEFGAENMGGVTSNDQCAM